MFLTLHPGHPAALHHQISRHAAQCACQCARQHIRRIMNSNIQPRKSHQDGERQGQPAPSAAFLHTADRRRCRKRRSGMSGRERKICCLRREQLQSLDDLIRTSPCNKAFQAEIIQQQRKNKTQQPGCPCPAGLLKTEQQKTDHDPDQTEPSKLCNACHHRRQPCLTQMLLNPYQDLSVHRQ